MVKTINDLINARQSEDDSYQLTILDELTSDSYLWNYEQLETGACIPSAKCQVKHEFVKYFRRDNKTPYDLWLQKLQLLEKLDYSDEARDVKWITSSVFTQEKSETRSQQPQSNETLDENVIAYVVIPSLNGHIIETITSIKLQTTQKRVVANIVVVSDEEITGIENNYKNYIRIIKSHNHHKINGAFKAGGLFEINIIRADREFPNKAILMNLGIRLAYYSKAKYIGLLESGDILLKNHSDMTTFTIDQTEASLVHCDLHFVDKEGKFIDMNANTVEANRARWTAYTRDNYNQESIADLKQCSFIHVSGTVFDTKTLIELEKNTCLCDPRFDQYSTIQEIILRLDHIAINSPNQQIIAYYQEKLVKVRTQKYNIEALAQLKLRPQKKNILILCYADNISRGVEPALSKRTTIIENSEQQDVYMCIHDLDSTHLIVYKVGHEHLRFEFENRRELLNYLASLSPANNRLLDEIRIYNWHFLADFYDTHFNTDPMTIEAFTSSFLMATVVYPDQEHKLKELEIVNQKYRQILVEQYSSDRFENLNPKQRLEFLKTHHLRPRIKNINAFERKIYSQNGEDGIINAIFAKIGVTNQFFVEFGVENGIECNTRYLREQKGWSGLMMDGHENLPENIKREFITAENIQHLFQKYNVPKQFDLLSIDLDFNDFWVWKAIKEYEPRVVIIEYNSTLPFPESKVVEYNSQGVWDGTNYFGASLAAMIQLGKTKGYTLIGCDNRGINAFFVADSLINDHFDLPQPEQLYRTPVWGPIENGIHTGHRKSFRKMLDI